MRRSTVKTSLQTVLRRQKCLTLALLISIAGVVGFSLLPPQILKLLVDDVLTPGRTEGLSTLAALYFASFALIGVFDFFKGFLLTVFGQKIVRELRDAMAEKLTRMKASYFSGTPSGIIASHILNDVENISALFTDGVVSMAIDCLKIVGIVFSIWLFSVRLGLFVLCLLPLLYGLTTYFRRRMLASQIDNLNELGKVNSHIAESIKNIRMVKAFHKERYMEGRYEAYLRKNYATMNRVNFYDSCYSPMVQVITALVTAVVLWMASGDSVLGISIGMLTATIALVTNLFAPVDNLGTELQSIQKGVSGIRSVDAFLAQAEDEKWELPLDIEALRREGARLCFDRMSFAYEQNAPVLEQISLQIEPGENLCFMGRTGVGKTTLFRLITGLLRPTEGAVILNGVDVSCIPNSQKRQIFGYVEQQFHFVRGDISAQLSLGDTGITQAQIEAAMAFTGLHAYILTLEEGYQTDADGGSLFSQGQTQLLSIARALVTDPPILLLDEVTANLDAVTEENVVSVLKRAGRDKTILSITHRASSALGSDRVVVLEHGRIASVDAPPPTHQNFPRAQT